MRVVFREDQDEESLGKDSAEAVSDAPEPELLAFIEEIHVFDGSERCKLFTLWEYPNGAPEYVRINVESWRRHSHGRCSEPIFLNEQNIRNFIPDLPEEYFRIPYQAAKSDVVRYAVIFHNGGIYMDTDFLVQEDCV